MIVHHAVAVRLIDDTVTATEQRLLKGAHRCCIECLELCTECSAHDGNVRVALKGSCDSVKIFLSTLCRAVGPAQKDVRRCCTGAVALGGQLTLGLTDREGVFGDHGLFRPDRPQHRCVGNLPRRITAASRVERCRTRQGKSDNDPTHDGGVIPARRLSWALLVLDLVKQRLSGSCHSGVLLLSAEDRLPFFDEGRYTFCVVV